MFGRYTKFLPSSFRKKEEEGSLKRQEKSKTYFLISTLPDTRKEQTTKMRRKITKERGENNTSCQIQTRGTISLFPRQYSQETQRKRRYFKGKGERDSEWLRGRRQSNNEWIVYALHAEEKTHRWSRSLLNQGLKQKEWHDYPMAIDELKTKMWNPESNIQIGRRKKSVRPTRQSSSKVQRDLMKQSELKRCLRQNYWFEFSYTRQMLVMPSNKNSAVTFCFFFHGHVT